MELFFDLLEVLGHWMVFSFSLYEGLLNLGEHSEVAKKYEKNIGRLRFGFFTHAILPLYFYKLKEAAMQIAKMRNASAAEAEALLKLIDRAILWIYLSIGGWFVWLCALYNLIPMQHSVGRLLFFTAMAALGTFLSVFNVKLRIKKRRERLCKLTDEGCTNEDGISLP